MTTDQKDILAIADLGIQSLRTSPRMSASFVVARDTTRHLDDGGLIMLAQMGRLDTVHPPTTPAQYLESSRLVAAWASADQRVVTIRDLPENKGTEFCFGPAQGTTPP